MSPLVRKGQAIDWEYDAEADTLYVTFGLARPAVGIDCGEGVVLRYDEAAREIVGLTLVGVGRRIDEFVRAVEPAGS